MQMEPHVKLCPNCLIEMKIKFSTVKDDYDQILNFYSIYCKKCGDGSVNAYFSKEDAIQHWNNEILTNYLPTKISDDRHTYI